MSSESWRETLADQPHQIIDHNGTRFVILGTAHVSRKSVDVVSDLLNSGAFDTAAIELDETRYEAIQNPDRFRQLDIIKVIRSGQTGLIATNLALSAYQKRLADQLGITPGAEMKAAIDIAREKNLNLWRIDRNISTTMKRAWRNMKFSDKMGLLFGGFAGFFEKEAVSEEDIEKLKSGDMLESTFAEFAEGNPSIYQSLIAERDQYMAARLQQEAAANDSSQALVVIGAGHLEGLSNHLRQNRADADATVAALDTVPPKSRWLKWLPWIIVGVILAGFAIGFSRNADMGWGMVKTWVLYNGILAAIGAALAGAHPLTVLTAFLAAPLTSLNPAVAAGMVAALTEAWIRKPKVADFERLQTDAASLKGWWKNPVTRILLVFVLTNLGSAIGTWVSGFKIFHQLV
jgi:pheromone shutdown-related protein TraB